MFRIVRSLLRVKQDTLNDLHPMVREERRKQIMTKALALSPKMEITNKSSPYYEAYALVKQEKRNDLTRYQNSIMWSPHFTPKHFKYLFLVPAVLVTMLLLYIRYIANPKRMMEIKRRLGVRFKELEKRGWLNGWEDDDDPVLRFQAWTLEDLDRLEKQGLLDGNKQSLQRRTKKFVTGNKQFTLADFKKN